MRDGNCFILYSLSEKNWNSFLQNCFAREILRQRNITSLFFNLFFEVEHFATILIAHGTHRRSQKFV